MSDSNEQRGAALKKATEKRVAMKNLRLKLEGGHLTIAEVLLPEPSATAAGMPVVELIRWVPLYGKKAGMRWRRLGDLALKADVNLLVNAEDMPVHARKWLVDVVTNSAAAPRKPETIAALSEDDDVRRMAHSLAYTERRLRAAEKARDAAVNELGMFSRMMEGQQFALPTVEAERMLAELADAVEIHRRTVSGPSPPASWAMADEALWREKDAILSSSVKLRAVA